MAGATRFRLDDEQREWVRNCLRKAGVGLVEPFDDFIDRIERSVDHFRAAKPEGRFRQAHDALRDIAIRSREEDPSPAQLLGRLRTLPSQALEDLGRRAPRAIPKLFPGENLDGLPFEAPEKFAARFLRWAESAPPKALVRALRSLSTDGGRWVKGRSRGGGKRSAAQFEPQVLGVVRGSSETKPKGGRPSEDLRHQLVIRLALNWCEGTGQMADQGRSDQTGFGELVHSVIAWLYVPSLGTQDVIDEAIESAREKANYALRRYWTEKTRAAARRSPSFTPSQYCIDCRWVLRQGDSLDDFLCGRLNVSCTTARKAAEACGPEGTLFAPR
jgi:hypothetical protein